MRVSQSREQKVEARLQESAVDLADHYMDPPIDLHAFTFPKTS